MDLKAASPLTLRASPFNPRVVGGQNAEQGQFPYQISLRLSGSHNCGGTILNNRWILTAAHCLKDHSLPSLQVEVGTIKLNDPSARVYEIAESIIHENYNAGTMVNDVGLIRVTEDIEFNDNVQPCELETEDIGGDVPVILSGWGGTRSHGPLPEILQWATLRTITFAECRRRRFDVVLSNICTNTKNGQGACNGDSGGPIVRDGKVCGIVSWGRPCATGHPDVNTRVSSFVDWINEKINN